jgi:hypothetical protein
MVTTVPELVARLAAHGAVVGLVRYGNRPVGATGTAGDLDLFVLVDDRPPELESVHFYVGDLPVDLNVRIWRDLERDEPLTPIDGDIYRGEVIYDRDGDLAARLRALAARWEQPPPPLSAHDIAFIRFGHRHSLDGARGRLASAPIPCRLILETNLYWLVQNYFLMRQLPFRGEKVALRYLERHEPAIWEDIGRFYAASDLGERLAIAEALGERVLAPVGGLWRRGEVLAFGTAEATGRLQETGRRFLRALLGGAADGDA